MTEQSRQTCPICGEELPGLSGECPNCGAVIESARAASPAARKKTRKRHLIPVNSQEEAITPAKPPPPETGGAFVAESILSLPQPVFEPAPLRRRLDLFHKGLIGLVASLGLTLLVVSAFLFQSSENGKSQAITIGNYQELLREAQATEQAQGSQIVEYEQSLGAAQATLVAQASQITIKAAKIIELTAQVQGLQKNLNKTQDELADANSEIESLQALQPAPVTIENQFSKSVYVIFDDDLAIYAPSQESVTFYVKPGLYYLKACFPEDMSVWKNCADWGYYTIPADGYSLTINP